MIPQASTVSCWNFSQIHLDITGYNESILKASLVAHVFCILPTHFPLDWYFRALKLPVLYLFFVEHFITILEVCFGLLSTWKTMLWPGFWGLADVLIYPHNIPSLWCHLLCEMHQSFLPSSHTAWCCHFYASWLGCGFSAFL